MKQKPHNMSTLSEQMEHLRERGFKHDFKFENGALTLPEEHKTYQPKELTIVQHYRFEGDSDPADMSVLYAIEASDGLKGILVDGFGTSSTPDLDDFLRDVPDVHKGNVY